MSDDFVPGQRMGDYEILGVLGAGGMGKVYKVRNVISDRVEAMKVLLANLAGQKELADRFLREIKLLASLNHPNIAALNTALTLDNQLVMMMEYVDGATLASRLQQGPIPPADAVNYSDQLLSALSYAHKLNVIHRDVKPANMMLTPQGVIKLMDFGIARPNNEAGMTVTGTTLGSLNYMSPEQVRGEPVDQRSDLYSMGVALYEMVTGQLPFRGHSNYSVMSAHLQETPQAPIVVRPGLPQGLSDIILMAMAKDPKDRFQSAEAFSNALKSTIQAGAAGVASAVPGAVRVPQGAPAISAARVPVQATVPMAVAAEANAAHRSSNRGVYMVLGGLIAVIVLFAAGYYVPRIIKTHASAGSAGPAATTQPVTQPADAPVDISAPPPDAVPANAVPAPPVVAARPKEDPAVIAARQEAERKEREEEARKAALLKEAEAQTDQLEARSAAISQGLDNLRHAQQSQGYGLRGDIVQTEQMMQINLSRAQSALHSGEVDQAKEYLDKAETQATTLERFLGR
jgi:eukaryotic-like serine/threonine-protein kinase